MSVTDLDEYHLQIPLGTKSIDDFILNMKPILISRTIIVLCKFRIVYIKYTCVVTIQL